MNIETENAKPKRPLNPFFRFKEAMLDDYKVKSKEVKMIELVKLMAEDFKALDVHSKQKYELPYKKEYEVWKRQNEDYKRKSRNLTKNSKTKPSSQTSTVKMSHREDDLTSLSIRSKPKTVRSLYIDRSEECVLRGWQSFSSNRIVERIRSKMMRGSSRRKISKRKYF